ncbi:MAG: hypothetical protein AAGE52_03270 [Myxococcota bacterium]
MSSELLAVLRSMRDIPGVLGSLVAEIDGRILASDLPPFYAADVQTALAERVSLLFEGAGEVLVGTDGISIAFGGHQLVARRGGKHVILFITNADTVAETLRVPANLVLRRLTRPQSMPHLGSSSSISRAYGGASMSRSAQRSRGSASAMSFTKPSRPSSKKSATKKKKKKKSGGGIWGD